MGEHATHCDWHVKATKEVSAVMVPCGKSSRADSNRDDAARKPEVSTEQGFGNARRQQELRD
jgi:hypothetical protein